MGQMELARQAIDNVWLPAKGVPVSRHSAIYFAGIQPPVLIYYTRVGAYTQALVVAQSKVDSQERDRLVQLVQCATR